MTRRGKPNVTLRLDPRLWETFGALTDDRSAIMRDFISWYVREPGARMPKRPDRSADPDLGGDRRDSAA